ncbi:MaoC/PaaZ C-terminal domain-containing protein [Variovorax sp. PBL-E5]|uniref:MaoC/PaaZ C-terminal domain-containing protein n=1 Tax=Variovorax sp. PBL-E5 TaxID=434014 RepID=UPI001315D0C4|nr:MaoC/PaaZ C-terminal domain-containing protein [Variovorax sp. PBL-E5]VTU38655.1 bifunctional enoyl-CoA hydratase/phosphate acetyltransferase [Variovorax sp. PBL-E5]
MTKEFYVQPGDSASFSKTVGEYDVYGFAGITGDFAPNHVNQQYMQKSKFGKLQAHGALLVGYMSTVSSLAIAHMREGADETPVALGFDRVRFLAPIFFGDTVHLKYEFTDVDTERRRSTAHIDVTNQHGTLVAVAVHILKWVRNES